MSRSAATVRATLAVLPCSDHPASGAEGRVTAEQVEQAHPRRRPLPQGPAEPGRSWSDADARVGEGTTALVTLALLTAGEPLDDPQIARALNYLEQFTAHELGQTYSVALQTMVFATADPERYRVQLADNVEWLERAQIKPGDRVDWPGSWTYDERRAPRETTRTPSTPCSA